jgi:hypothetical protein
VEQINHKQLLQLLNILLLACGLLLLNRIYKTFVLHQPETTYVYRMLPKTKINSLVTAAVQQEARPVVMSCYDRDYALYNYQQPYALIETDSLLAAGTIRSAKPVWLFVITKDIPTEKELKIIESNQLILLTKEPGYYCLYRNR